MVNNSHLINLFCYVVQGVVLLLYRLIIRPGIGLWILGKNTEDNFITAKNRTGYCQKQVRCLAAVLTYLFRVTEVL